MNNEPTHTHSHTHTHTHTPTKHTIIFHERGFVVLIGFARFGTYRFRQYYTYYHHMNRTFSHLTTIV
jgi:hypothetical protein